MASNTVSSTKTEDIAPFVPRLPNFSHFTIKLDRNNYLIWKSQWLPILYSTDMLPFVDGTFVPPKEHIESVNESGEKMLALNPEYIAWKKEINCFSISFMQLLLQRSSLKWLVTTSPELPSFEALYNMLLNHEKRLEQYHYSTNENIGFAFFTARGRGGNRACGHGRGGGREHDTQTRLGGFTQTRLGGSSHASRGRGTFAFNTRGTPAPLECSFIICQICNKAGYNALHCRQHHNFTYQPDDFPSAFFAMNFSTDPYDST
ncbi:hypothetical protein AMTR_s00024p00088110 [Amborella trichopoda]|uniref:Uncharacterized protein n=1 Tax=Amborella trichopoda TaxID=13333 RepID=W1PUR3_AMBTC|nr:hypothetical protein AMTR_s00024p00088110 [Amborella trichopoda]